jgi:hypothetical protein
VLSEKDPESAMTSLAVSIPSERVIKKDDKLTVDEPITPRDLSYEAIRSKSINELISLKT